MENLYQLIVVDVNNMYIIIMMDMVELCCLLLDDIDYFINNMSYCFIFKNYDFLMLNNFWMEEFFEFIMVENVFICVLGLDFVFLKVGDVVNGSFIEGFSVVEIEE